ncbi:hypothetical protein [Flavobacterium hercynium]|uniref:Uncharacterized protein n=1 Tax=Flavobacterium hercynium TaxID=387094 RepID=A0A226GTW6_9FLAO|nr:hypothetical protein [Flavobacterium hercynium]OXA84886.1 hypothetical protein B0A66_20585 [Flavobacterium hercynium]SMP22173.1 hypothetical protein SAMN06265346_107138 [Flavobacterium hercynium]
MIDYFLEKKIIDSVEKSRKRAESKLKLSTHKNFYDVFKGILNSEFRKINDFQIGLYDKSTITYVDKIVIEKKEINSKDHNFDKSVGGSSLILLGQPILKKRFVMKGSAAGTSIASKYLSRAFPQKMPVRILGTNVLGRAIGRVVPYVGWTLVAIDIIEIIIEYSECNEKDKSVFYGGFGGGSFSGGGSEGKW